MRGAGCTINDLWDRNLDKAVGEHRTHDHMLSFELIILSRKDKGPPFSPGPGQHFPSRGISWRAVDCRSGGIVTIELV